MNALLFMLSASPTLGYLVQPRHLLSHRAPLPLLRPQVVMKSATSVKDPGTESLPSKSLTSSVINLSKNIICGGFLSLPAGTIYGDRTRGLLAATACLLAATAC